MFDFKALNEVRVYRVFRRILYGTAGRPVSIRGVLRGRVAVRTPDDCSQSHGRYSGGDDHLQHSGGGQQYGAAGYLFHQNGKYPRLSKTEKAEESSMMDARCIVNAGEFQKALEKVLKVAPKKCSIPVLMEVLVQFDGDACTLIQTLT